MNFREKIYTNLPLSLQNLACTIEGKKILKRRYSKEFFKLLNELRYRDRSENIEQFQIQKLKEQLNLAYQNSSYYKELFDSLNFKVEKFESLEQLKTLPIHTKESVKENLNSMINPNVDKSEIISAHTSGTTGGGLIFPQTKYCERLQWATWWRYRLNHKIELDTFAGYFGGRAIVPIKSKKPPFWRVVEPMKQVMFSMYHLNRYSFKFYIEELNRLQLKWIHGYPSTLSFLASLMVEEGVSLNYKLEHITTGAESLLEHQKGIIYRAFGVKPIQHYGLSEPVANISECKEGNLHIDEDFSYVELLPIGEDRFRVIGTSLFNDSLLFLRYDTNDIVTVDKSCQCSCGLNGRVISSIDGRVEDFLTLKDGTKLGRLDHIFKDMVNIKEAQIRQSKSGEIKFLISKSKNYSEKDKKALISEIESRIDSKDYKIEYVDSILKSKRGKLRLVVSEFNKG